MRFDIPFAAADPVAIASSLGAAQASLGAAVTARNAANRRWRNALLGDDLAETIAARAALSVAGVEVDRAEALIERLSERLSEVRS